jgi:hypothetical protein
VSWIPLALLVVSSPLPIFFLLATIHRVSFVHYLHLVHVRDTKGHSFINILFVRAPPNHQAISLYLMLTDERFPNALLLAGLFPLNSTHLLWK